MTIATFALCAAAVGVMMTLLWIASVIKRDASIVDPWWSIGFLLVALVAMTLGTPSTSKLILLTLVAVWAVRLWLHLLSRARGKAEDPRYQKFRQRFGAQRYWWVSFFQVFMLQGALLLIISLPLQLAMSAPLPDPMAINDWLGALVAISGIAIETAADWQLQRFRNTPSQRGKVLDTGLWHYSRHPNYFGECVVWWGLWLCTLDARYGVLTIVSPALITFLLLRVSGVTMLEAQLGESKPGYAEYIATTSAFVPWRKKARA